MGFLIVFGIAAAFVVVIMLGTIWLALLRKLCDWVDYEYGPTLTVAVFLVGMALTVAFPIYSILCVVKGGLW